MPTYEYRCEKCEKKFTLVMRISEHSEKSVKLFARSVEVKRRGKNFSRFLLIHQRRVKPLLCFIKCRNG